MGENLEGVPVEARVETPRPAGMPADWGLTPLGLLMDLAGLMLVIAGGIFALTGLVMAVESEPGAHLMLLFGATSILRSELHRRAGRGLVYGHPRGALRPLKHYLAVAAVHSVVGPLCLLAALDVSPFGLASVMLMIWLICWPAVVYAIARRTPYWRAPTVQLTPSEDGGYESLAVLMVVLGALGAVMLASGTFNSLGQLGLGPHLILALPVLALLAYRSVLHLRAGIAGVRGVGGVRFEEAGIRYSNAAILIAVGTAIAAFVAALLTLGGAVAFLAPPAVFLLLFAWPRIVSQFLRARSYDHLVDPGATTISRAPDLGLTALGWLLAAAGVWSVAAGAVVAAAAWSASPELMALGGAASDEELLVVLLRAAVGALQLWAGIELLCMTRRWRKAATAFVGVAIANAVWAGWEQLLLLGEIGLTALTSQAHHALMLTTDFVPALILPVTTLALIRRRPAASARVVSTG